MAVGFEQKIQKKDNQQTQTNSNERANNSSQFPNCTPKLSRLTYTAIKTMISFLKDLLALNGPQFIRFLDTAVTVSHLACMLCLVVSFVLASAIVVYQLLRRFVLYLRAFEVLFWLRIGVGMLLLLAIPLSGITFMVLCSIIVRVGTTTMLTICFFVGIVAMVIAFVAVVVVGLLHRLHRLVCSLSRLTTWIRNRHRKIDLVATEMQVVEFDVQDEELDVERVDREEETEVHSPTLPLCSAPRRSGRIRNKPDRWVPPSGRTTTQPVLLGSFFDRGVRRSSRIAAARLALR
ncbi:MAG: hypothetical protein LW863_11070 [Flammeovirgaceae bacterium]|nr:hypothetical protein [Flammeovirgaceae bacterium]